MGSVIVTSVAPGLQFPGWILSRSMHNLAFGFGSVVRKPRVVHLTVLFDHDVVDGAPAARFVSHFTFKQGWRKLVTKNHIDYLKFA